MDQFTLQNKRLESVVDLIIQFAQGNFDAREQMTDEDDHINAIISGLNMLGEELGYTRSELTNKNLLLQNILDNIDEIVYVVDTDKNDIINKSRFNIMGSQVKNVLGYSQDELTGDFSSWSDIIYPHDVEIVKNAIKVAVYSGETTRFAYRMMHKLTREYIWLEDTLVPQKGADGNVVHLFGSAHNISERKKSEEMLVEQKRFMDYILNALPADIAVFDASQRYVFISPNAEKNPEIRKWVIGKTDLDLHRQKGRNTALAQVRLQKVQQAIESGKEAEWIEEDASEGEAEKKYILEKHQPVFEGNTLKYIIRYGTDISQLKKSEVEKGQLISELNKRYNELTQFNYIVSHNLRAPVANIRGLSTLLKAPISEAEKSKTIDYITRAAENIDHMLFDLNTILSAKSPLNEKIEAFSMLQVIEEAKNNLERQIADSNATITLSIDPGAEHLRSIKSYIQSTVFNLISNAIKYKSVEPLHISIDIKQRNAFTTIEVRDNGLGIDLETHGKYMFGLYKRFNMNVEGKGLGLHMSKVQVESLGGSIAVKSEPGKGSLFTVSIPCNLSL